MTKTLTRALIIAGALLVVGSVNYSAYSKHAIVRDGRTIYLELAPVDPRSLMQGDYMALRFELANAIEAAQLSAATQSVPLRIDARLIARLGDGATRMPRLKFKRRNGSIWLGTNAYFFEEGTAQRYEGARYGEFRLDPDSGEAILVSLRDEHLRKL